MIVSLSGLIGSGKDTVADMLVEQHGYKRESFAGTLKDVVAVMFNWDREMLEGKTEQARKQREVVDQWWAKRLGIPQLSPRWVLQHFGTEVVRQHFHNDIWVATLENKLRKMGDNNIVISDSRFSNELAMLANAGAVTVCVSRGPKPEWWELAKQAMDNNIEAQKLTEMGIHKSEWDWAKYEFDVKISNNGTLKDLEDKVNSEFGSKVGAQFTNPDIWFPR